MLQSPASKKVSELLLHIVREQPPFGGLMFQKRWVVLLNQLVQERLFGLMAVVGWFGGRYQLANG